MKITASLVLGIQVVGVLIVMSGYIGFDRRGRFGMDLDQLILSGAIEVVLLIALAVLSIAKKQCWPVALSAAVVGAGVALAFSFL